MGNSPTQLGKRLIGDLPTRRVGMQTLLGKVAVVTGGASGIGLAMAKRFGEEGMKVVVADTRARELEIAAADLRAAGTDVLEVVTDVGDPTQVDELARLTTDRFGAAHILCNNAGVIGGGTPWATDLEEWERVLRVNLWGVIHGIRSFVPAMIHQGEGHVVNTSSMAGLLFTSAAPAPYTVSKMGVVALSEQLHHNLAMAGASVHVSVLCPGSVNTPLARDSRHRYIVAATPDITPSEVEARLAQLAKDGMDPAAVAHKVVEAILEKHFYVLTQDDERWIALLRERMLDVVERRNPIVRLLPAEIVGGSPVETNRRS
jgi:NAD(P)-dependent dehydrogenase (short-subunit alcohol dehydrogenase family)